MKRKTTEQFIYEAKNIHGDKYDYSMVTYKGNKKKVKIICTQHGEFEQRPDGHISSKRGCRACSRDRLAHKFSYSLKHFIDESVAIHGDSYDYSHVFYINMQTKVKIFCKNCNDLFEQRPDDHIHKKSGCIKCGRKKQIGSWKYTSWARNAKTSKDFCGFILYILECRKSDECFIKIGKTFRKLEKRFPNKKSMPYEFRKIKEIYSKNPEFISNLEKNIQSLLVDYKYKPSIEFGGMHECYLNNSEVIDIVNSVIIRGIHGNNASHQIAI